MTTLINTTADRPTLQDYCDRVANIVGGITVFCSPNYGVVRRSNGGLDIELQGPAIPGWRAANRRIIRTLPGATLHDYAD